MKLLLERIYKAPTYTIGRLYLNGDFFCNTLEDVVRPAGVKVYGETAIPFGTYKVKLTMSQRFKKVMPILLSVPMFEGIRIHAGNTEADTSGCILVGENTVKGKVINSTATFKRLMERLSGDNITIEIV